MEIEIPDLNDLEFVTTRSHGRKGEKQLQLTPVGERLLAFLKSIGVLIANPDGWRGERVGETSPCYSVGPFMVDPNKKVVTLQPGVYTVTQPVVFGIIDETEITGVTTAPLPKDNKE